MKAKHWFIILMQPVIIALLFVVLLASPLLLVVYYFPRRKHRGQAKHFVSLKDHLAAKYGSSFKPEFK